MIAMKGRNCKKDEVPPPPAASGDPKRGKNANTFIQ
jgi:hypothetical protein